MPDSVEFARANAHNIFPAGSKASDISVAPPRPNGFGWTVCLRANFSNVAGKPTGPQTFVLQIDNGKVGDRRRAEQADGCDTETYRAV
jgi:hypothetical protein